MTFTLKKAVFVFSLSTVALFVIALLLSACGDNNTTIPASSRLAQPLPTPTTIPIVTPDLDIFSGTIEKPGNPAAPSTLINSPDGRSGLILWNQDARILMADGQNAAFTMLEKGMKLEVRGRFISISEKQVAIVPAQIKIIDLGPDYDNATLNDQQARASLVNYFKAISAQDYEAAYNLLAYQVQKQEHNSADYAQAMRLSLGRVNDVKIVEGPQPDNASGGQTYKVTLDLKPGEQASNWQSSPNLRCVVVVKENGVWHIVKISTSR